MTRSHWWRELLFPVRICPACGRKQGGGGLCPRCLEQMRQWRRCPRCGSFQHHEDLCPHCQMTGQAPFRQARAALPYQGALRQALLGLKYERKLFWARPLALVLAQVVTEFYATCSLQLVVPVPLSPQRFQERTYNQAALLCAALEKQEGLRLAGQALHRLRDTPPLSQLPRRQRWELLQNSFAADAALVAHKRVLLVDDIFTTGATATACSQALLAAGAEEVWVATVAAGFISREEKAEPGATDEGDVVHQRELKW